METASSKEQAFAGLEPLRRQLEILQDWSVKDQGGAVERGRQDKLEAARAAIGQFYRQNIPDCNDVVALCCQIGMDTAEDIRDVLGLFGIRSSQEVVRIMKEAQKKYGLDYK